MPLSGGLHLRQDVLPREVVAVGSARIFLYGGDQVVDLVAPPKRQPNPDRT